MLEASLQKQFIGIDLHTNRFTCCYRDGDSTAKGEKTTETFELTDYGMAQFYQTLTAETHVLIEATITTFCFARLIQPLVKDRIEFANALDIDMIMGVGAPMLDKIRRSGMWNVKCKQVPIQGGAAFYWEPIEHPIAKYETIDETKTMRADIFYQMAVM